MENLAANNKLIRSFLGSKFCIKDSDGKLRSMFSYFDNELLFHSDWNWLMKLVNEITTEEDFQTDYPGNFLFWEEFNRIDLEATYMACIEFIKWLKNQK